MAGRTVKVLSDGWLVQVGDKAYKTSIPTTAMGVLMNNGVYGQDILSSLNYQKIDKTVFDRPWLFRNRFRLPALRPGQHAFLKIDGLSYSANILFNEKLVAPQKSVKGAFRQYLFDVTEWAQTNNEVKIQLFRAQKADPNIGFVDWNPRPADESMGIFRDVSVIIVDDVLMQNTAVESKVNTNTLNEAWLTVETQLTNLTSKPVRGALVGKIGDIQIYYMVTLKAREKKLVKITPKDVLKLHINNPRLWWCNGMGKPEMYNLSLEFDVEDKVCDETSISFGIREIKDYLTADGHRGFKLNGKNVLLRGAGWTDDIFLRDNKKSYEQQIAMVKDMNLNTIRLEGFWGTSEELFNLCDRNGLMLLAGWSCQWEWAEYVGGDAESKFGCIATEPGMTMLVNQLHDQVLWLRNHPSLIGWFIGSDKLPCPSLEKRYREMLGAIDNRPILISAQHTISDISGTSGTKMYGPYEYVGPSYWYEDTKHGGNYGFNTETGIGAQLPVKESIQRMIPSEYLWPIKDNKYYNYHCTASKTAMHDLNVMSNIIDRKFGGASDLDDYLKKAHLLDYESTRAMFEAFRMNTNHATGIVQWMLNSAWPSLYWQLYDYYGVPTASYYSVKAGNMPQQLIYNYQDRSVYAVNESRETMNVKAFMRLYSLQAKPLQQDSVSLLLEPGMSKKIFNLTDFNDMAYLSLQLKRDKSSGVLAENEYMLTSKNDVYDYSKSTWYATPITTPADYQPLSTLPDAKLNVSIHRDGNRLRVQLKNETDKLSFFNELVLINKDGQSVQYALWNNNYLTLLPGETKEVSCTCPVREQNMSVVLRGWNSKEQTFAVQ
jgi:exo-1,4-beta-D-glucosaminidase